MSLESLFQLPHSLIALILSNLTFIEVVDRMANSLSFRRLVISSWEILQSLTVGENPLIWIPNESVELAQHLYNCCVEAGNWDILFQRHVSKLWDPYFVSRPSPGYFRILSEIETLGLQGYDFGLYTAALVYLKECGKVGEGKGLTLMMRLTKKRLPASKIEQFRRDLHAFEGWGRMYGVTSDRSAEEYSCPEHRSVDNGCIRCIAMDEVRKYLGSDHCILEPVGRYYS